MYTKSAPYVKQIKTGFQTLAAVFMTRYRRRFGVS